MSSPVPRPTRRINVTGRHRIDAPARRISSGIIDTVSFKAACDAFLDSRGLPRATFTDRITLDLTAAAATDPKP